jgi:hypothetical protein
LAARLMRETFGRGGLAMRPRVAQPSLGAAFIEPALAWLEASGAKLATGRRLKGLEFAGDCVSALVWSDGTQTVAADEAVILALPPWVAPGLVPGLVAPDEHNAIINGHFAFAANADLPRMLGVLHGTAEWIFVHDDRISVTVSAAADDLAERDREDLARAFWQDICRALGFSRSLPAWQIVNEKRATFAATPRQDALRPGARTAWSNLFLAGDWIQNGLPATIEGALRSGDNAARLALGLPLRYGLPSC